MEIYKCNTGVNENFNLIDVKRQLWSIKHSNFIAMALPVAMPKIGVCGLFTKASDALAPTQNLSRNLSASMQEPTGMAVKLGPK